MEVIVTRSYGAMTTILNFFDQLDQLRFHGLSKWWYNLGVGRIQTRLDLSPFCEHSDSVVLVSKSAKKVYDFNPLTRQVSIYRLSFNLPVGASWVQVPSTGQLFVFGGVSSKKLLQVDYRTGVAVTHPAEFNYLKCFHAVSALQTELVATGGSRDNGVKCERYDLRKEKWTELPDLTQGRKSHASCAFSRRFVYLFHGESVERAGSYLNSIEKLDLRGGKSWTQIQFQGPISRLRPQGTPPMFFQLDREEICLFGNVDLKTINVRSKRQTIGSHGNVELSDCSLIAPVGRGRFVAFVKKQETEWHGVVLFSKGQPLKPIARLS